MESDGQNDPKASSQPLDWSEAPFKASDVDMSEGMCDLSAHFFPLTNELAGEENPVKGLSGGLGGTEVYTPLIQGLY